MSFCEDDRLLNSNNTFLFLSQVEELPSPPSEPLHDLGPGDWIMVKNLGNKRKKQCRWVGPHQVLQTSNRAVMIAEGATWLDTSEFKRALEK